MLLHWISTSIKFTVSATFRFDKTYTCVTYCKVLRGETLSPIVVRSPFCKS